MGVGGVGVCGVAELLHAYGLTVTGSDIKEGATIARLRELGIDVTIGHDQKNIEKADAVVYSSAICESNPEWKAAIAKGIPVVQRAEMLAELMKQERGIAIAGTHGKTTTTSMVTHVLMTAGKSPSYAIGGELKGVDRYAQLGSGGYFVAEADESDASFLHYSPDIAVVTNIDADHMETYAGCFDRLKGTFADFLQNVSETGLAILAYDDEAVSQILSVVSCRTKTYGVGAGADLQLVKFSQRGIKSYFTVCWSDDGRSYDFCLNFPGQHNALNAMAAILIAEELGLDMSDVARALETFPGVGRRFHLLGDLVLPQGKMLIVDDYGHHPHEVDVTMQAARQAWPDRRLVLVFQPHRYSRTRDLLTDFARVLAKADALVVLEVFAAGEQPIKGADSRSLCEKITALGGLKPVYAADMDQLSAALKDALQDGDVVLMQGAGSISSMAKQLIAGQ